MDEYALYEALIDKDIAGIDVFSNEPLIGSPLTKLDNLILTPHMGGYTYEVLNIISKLTAENIVKRCK